MVKRKRDENKIIVVGLPEGTDGEALEAMFVGVGKVYAAHVVGYEPTTGKSRGYGFVTFAEEASCLAAVQAMHKTIVEGRTINVRLVEDRGDHTKAVLEPGKGVGVGKDANKVRIKYRHAVVFLAAREFKSKKFHSSLSPGLLLLSIEWKSSSGINSLLQNVGIESSALPFCSYRC